MGEEVLLSYCKCCFVLISFSPTVFIVLTCVRIIAQAAENVRSVMAATLCNVNVLKTGKVKHVTFLTVSVTVVLLIEASAIQVMLEDVPAFQSGRVGVSFIFLPTYSVFLI